MKLVLLPTAVALLAQFGSLPMLIGARGAGEAVGWPMIMAIFFGIPSGLVYLVMFASMRAATPPTAVAIALGVAVPAAVVLGAHLLVRRAVHLGPGNWVLWMAVIGGIAGTITYVFLRSTMTPIV